MRVCYLVVWADWGLRAIWLARFSLVGIGPRLNDDWIAFGRIRALR